MNVLGMIIAACVGATLVVFCGLKLFDIGSNLAEPIRRYGPFLGIILAIVSIFGFLLPDTLDVLSDNYILWISFFGALGFIFFGFMLAVARRCLLVPKRKKSRQLGRMSKLSIAVICGIDTIESIVLGGVAGVSFSCNVGTGIMVLCAMSLLLIAGKVNSIRRYQDALFTRKENIATLVISLLAFPIIAILVAAWARPRYAHIGVLLSLAIAYLAYLCIYHGILIVKRFQKR